MSREESRSLIQSLLLMEQEQVDSLPEAVRETAIEVRECLLLPEEEIRALEPARRDHLLDIKRNLEFILG